MVTPNGVRFAAVMDYTKARRAMRHDDPIALTKACDGHPSMYAEQLYKLQNRARIDFAFQTRCYVGLVKDLMERVQEAQEKGGEPPIKRARVGLAWPPSLPCGLAETGAGCARSDSTLSVMQPSRMLLAMSSRIARSLTAVRVVALACVGVCAVAGVLFICQMA